MTAVRPDTSGTLPSVVADSGGPVTVAHVAEADLEAVTAELADFPGARLADLFASGSDPVTLRAVWALDRDQRYLITETPVGGPRYPALSDIAPAAFAEECEIYEQFGIRPSGGKPLNRVATPPPQAEIDLPRLGRAPDEPPEDVHAPHVVGGHAFEFPFGPVRQVGVESLYYGLVTSGEEIVDLYLFTWHKHRGVEWRARGQTPQQALFGVERAEGLGAIANGWAFAAAAEAALGIEPGPAAMRQPGDRARAGTAVQPCGRRRRAVPGVRAGRRPRRRGDRARAAAAAQRGCVRPPLPVQRAGHRRRACGTGRGRVASGPARRVRRAAPRGRRAARNELVPRPARGHRHRHHAGGWSAGPGRPGRPGERGRHRRPRPAPVRLLCGACPGRSHPASGRRPGPAARPAGRGGRVRAPGRRSGRRGPPWRADGSRTTAAGESRSGLGWAESSRGESLAWVELDPSGRISRARLRPAAVRNWRGFDDACRSQNVFTDIPIIEASFWLTVAGTAR